MNRAIHTILAVAGASMLAAFSRATEFAPLFEAPEAASASLKYGGEQLAFGAPAETPLEDTPECAAKRLVYTSPDGLLQVEREIRRYKKFPITEFKTTLRNVSKKSASKNLSDLCVYSLILKNNPDNIKSDKVKIRRLKGAATTMFDFAEETVVLERRPQADSLLLENKTGYPASVWLPYFGADFDELNGALFAVGGCGNWSALFEIDRRNFSLKIGVPDCDFSLNPEESVSLPSVLVMRRQNMRIDRAQNIWRKFVFEHKTPKDADGKPVCAPIYTSIGGNIPTEKLVNIADFARVHELPFSMYGVDAGWFGGAHVPKKKGAFGDWMQNAGDWRVNTNVHPQKLLPLAKAANAAGMKFSLWIEIERVMPQTPLWREHPEFLAPSPDNSRRRPQLGRQKRMELRVRNAFQHPRRKRRRRMANGLQSARRHYVRRIRPARLEISEPQGNRHAQARRRRSETLGRAQTKISADAVRQLRKRRQAARLRIDVAHVRRVAFRFPMLADRRRG